MNPTIAEAFTIVARDTYADSADVRPIGPFRVTTPLPLLRESNPPTLVFGATQRIGSQLGTVTFPGTAYAEAVEGESDQFDVFIELTSAQTDRVAGAYAWAVRAEFAEAVQTVLVGDLRLLAALGPAPEPE